MGMADEIPSGLSREPVPPFLHDFSHTWDSSTSQGHWLSMWAIIFEAKGTPAKRDQLKKGVGKAK